ncbi:MAG: cyclic nucleotide-binding domain-containing protein [Caldimonas sp.]
MIANLIDEAARYGQLALSSPSEMLAILSVIVAAAFVLVSTFVKTMIPLRWLAIASNIGFVFYGALHPSFPMLVLHSALLPINIYRLVEMQRLTRRVERVAAEAGFLGVWLKPYMRSAKLRAGTVLFRKGDRGERFYLLADGRIDLVEFGNSVEPGEMFGEIAFFSPDRSRGSTAVCGVDSTVLSIDESTVRQLYYQNPAFGFKMMELVVGRLGADIRRVTDKLVAATADAKAAGASAAD